MACPLSYQHYILLCVLFILEGQFLFVCLGALFGEELNLTCGSDKYSNKNVNYYYSLLLKDTDIYIRIYKYIF